jgi:hypothetical protein
MAAMVAAVLVFHIMLQYLTPRLMGFEPADLPAVPLLW